jgi:hypothetical protein
MNKSLQWIMKAMERVKMNDRKEPAPILESSSVDGAASGSVEPAASSNK